MSKSNTTEVPLDITASVVLSEGASLEGITNAFEAALSAFCRDTALTTRLVSYARVSALLLDCEGVTDVTAFTLNGGSTSVPLDDDEAATVGTLTLTEVSA